ncbi:MAG: hypothetical protein WC655_12940 [Candidatus Hydrogenedentales bacterium]|jgi:hypothetical protein
MIGRKLISDEATIVVLGRFNPSIFQPQWFARYKLLRDGEVNSATVKFIDNSFSLFSTEWFTLQVISEQFFLSTKDPSKFLLARDLVAGTFGLLSHTPVVKFGLNRLQKYECEQEEEWHKIGHILAPKNMWEGVMTGPGLKLIQMEGSRPDSRADKVFVRLGPIDRPRVFFVHTNQHYDLDKESVSEPVEDFQRYIATEWESFLDYSNQVPGALLDQGSR